MADAENTSGSFVYKILGGFIKIIYFLSVVLSIVNFVKNWGNWDYIGYAICYLLIHIIFYYVIYDMVAGICTSVVYKHSARLRAESDELLKNQGRRLAAKICLIEPVLFIYYAWNHANVQITMDSILMATIFYVIPLVFVRNFIRQIKDRLPSERAVERLRRRKSRLSGESIWLLMNKTSYVVKEQYIDNKCDEANAGGYEGHCSYVLSVPELMKLYDKKTTEKQLMRQIWRWCYIVSVRSEQELEKVYETIYAAYSDAGNIGIRKIVILNILPSGEKIKLPEKYKRTEFIYYVQVTNPNQVSYRLLGKVAKDVQDGYGKGFAMATKKRKKKNKLERLFILLKDVFLVKRYNGDKNFFEHPETLLSRILESEDLKYDFRGGDEWLMDFYSSACVFETPERSIMAMLDYWELLLRMVAIYYYKRANNENISEERLVHANLMELARIIQNNAFVDQARYETLKEKKYYVAELIGGYIHYIDDRLYIDFEGTKVSFLGLVSLILTIRNKVVAHGVLNQDNSAIVWGVVYWATLLLNNYLDVTEFQLEEKNGKYEIGYEQKISASPLIIDKDGMPCIAALQKSNKNKSYVYVNYFSGELISPEFI